METLIVAGRLLLEVLRALAEISAIKLYVFCNIINSFSVVCGIATALLSGK